MATFFLSVSGDQLGTCASMSGTGNGIDRTLIRSGTQLYDNWDQLFTVRIDQAAADATECANGQFVTILDQNGNVVMHETTAQPDIKQGSRPADLHNIFQARGVFLYLTGVTPGKTAPGRRVAAGDAVTNLGGKADSVPWTCACQIALDHPLHPIRFRPDSQPNGGPDADRLGSPQDRMVMRGPCGTKVRFPPLRCWMVRRVDIAPWPAGP